VFKSTLPRIHHFLPTRLKRKNNKLLHSFGISSIFLNSHICEMTWPFCPSCHSTLRVDQTGSITCNVCPYRSNLGEMAQIPQSTTYSADRAIPLWAKSDEEQAAMQKTSEPVRATIEEPCIKCAHPEMGYYTVQLRSVDEGQTVFYECPNCKHTWSINN
jgi:DNA-directed RNA polymerase I subunit RPA12